MKENLRACFTDIVLVVRIDLFILYSRHQFAVNGMFVDFLFDKGLKIS